jgi:RNA polymerase sigma factor (sigma-70 family)
MPQGFKDLRGGGAMSLSASFADLLERLRKRDNDAATEVVRRFTGRLIGLARARLNPKLRSKVGPEDIVQSVFNTVFKRLSKGQFDLGGWDSFWLLLARVTARRCGRWAQRYSSQSRNIAREIALGRREDQENAPEQELAAPDPTPEEAAELVEVIERLMRKLNARHRPILALALEGQTVAQISERVEYSERTVERVLHKVYEQLEAMRDEVNSDEE